MATQWKPIRCPEDFKQALRACFLTGLPRYARNDARGESMNTCLSKGHSGQAGDPPVIDRFQTACSIAEWNISL